MQMLKNQHLWTYFDSLVVSRDSNPQMDCFLDLLITAADVFEKTEHQKKLISFLKDQKGISCIRMGTINRKRLY